MVWEKFVTPHIVIAIDCNFAKPTRVSTHAESECKIGQPHNAFKGSNNMGKKSAVQEPFAKRLLQRLSSRTAIVFPRLRWECQASLKEHWDSISSEKDACEVERAIYAFADGNIKWYAPTIAFALRQPTAHDGIIDDYVQSVNACADDGKEGDALPPDPVADTVAAIYGMVFKTSVDDCNGKQRECPKCRDEAMPYPRQTCSSDEGFTIWFKCSNPDCLNDFRG